MDGWMAVVKGVHLEGWYRVVDGPATACPLPPPYNRYEIGSYNVEKINCLLNNEQQINVLFVMQLEY